MNILPWPIYHIFKSLKRIDLNTQVYIQKVQWPQGFRRADSFRQRNTVVDSLVMQIIHLILFGDANKKLSRGQDDSSEIYS